MDWKKLIADLTRSGLTQVQIAERCKVRQSAISMLATGRTKEPKHSLGESLKALLVNGATQPAGDAPGIAHAGRRLPPGVTHDRRDPSRISPYAGSDIDRRVPADWPAPGAPMQDVPAPCPWPSVPAGGGGERPALSGGRGGREPIA